MNDPRPSPTSTALVCDVCQHEQAIVTLGCVDYCARCAPPWHPSFAPVDDELVAV